MGKEFFLLFKASRQALNPKSAISTNSACPGDKAANAWKAPSRYSAKIKNAQSHSSDPPYAFMAGCLTKHGDFTLYT